MNDKIEQIALWVTAIVSIAVALADFLGVLDTIPWLSERIPTLSLLLLAVIIGYLSLERRSKLDKIEETANELTTRMTALESQYAQTGVLFRALGRRDHFFEIALIYGLRAYGRLLSERRVVVDRDHALDFWLDSIRGCKRWLGVTYSRPEESWDLQYGETIALAVQQERIRSGGEIKRLFLVDDQAEYEHLKGVMKEQEAIGVTVRWLLKDELPQQRRIRECIDALGTLDFALVDDSWVWQVNLDRVRRITGSEATKDRLLAEKARVAFNEIFNAGELP